MIGERWALHPSGYWVSDLGRVRGKRKALLTPFAASSGRYRFIHCGSRQHAVHRMVWEAFHGPIPEDKEINHKDGNTANNALANIETVTHSENMIHALQMGLKKPLRGQDHYSTSLTNEDVLDIYRRVDGGENNRQIGVAHHLDPKTVSLIRHGHSWPHLHQEFFAGRTVPNGWGTNV